MTKKNHDDPTPQFRRWLVSKLKQSMWAEVPGETIEDTARRLWIRPEALRAAQAELNAERKRLGRALVKPGRFGRLPGTAVERIYELAMPEAVLRDWEAYCQLRGLESGMLLRSIIHHLLLSPTNPPWTGRGWLYRGRLVRMSGNVYRAQGKKWPWSVHTRITYGSLQALRRRALASNAKGTALIRGFVIELLEGRLTRLTLVTTLEEMYEDPDRYYVMTAR